MSECRTETTVLGMKDDEGWAEEEFGSARLGNSLRTARLVKMAAELRQHPHASVLQAIETAGDREGAYRWLERVELDTDEVDAARARACLKRMEECGGEVIIPIDQTSFTLPDHAGEKDFGSVGNRCRERSGVHCLTALPLDRAGTPLGVLSQVFWTRSETPGPVRIRPNKKERDHRSPDEKESNYWIECLSVVCQRLGRLSPRVRPWLQCDRGADFWGALTTAAQYDVDMTVRVYTNRKIVLDDGEETHLMPWLAALPRMARYRVKIPAQDGRRARNATMSLRWGRSRVWLGPTASRRQLYTFFFVEAREEHPPADTEPLCWKLATSVPVESAYTARRVVHNYQLRWRIEELHRTLKSGVCNLETSQLGSFETFRRWAMLHASVAARVERLKYLARTQPDAPASVEFTRPEIDTAIALRRKHTTKNKPPYRPGDTPTIAELTFWIADMGGYAGSRSHPKPGTVPLARGLERLANAVEALVAVGFFPREKPD